ncbi:hypothetical protein [Parasegetibacter sp. NRK P23]|uniref:hypothetical protein n=1 Tax=Parasegetibacter sp. NRK P23 TaxID=2942999 RepID=UPI002043961C|nr:hypothetical protein [Parasegetibacter sp. NRK P23]MCM5527901.1 hypothetical protein [Parasegetibacter sp. NRK P23]
MRYILLALSFTIIGCSVQKKQPLKDYWISTYKNIAFIAAIKMAHPNLEKSDISPGVNFSLIGSDAFASEADSLGKAFYNSIIPPMLYKEQNLKAALNESLAFYKSKRLDKLARSAFKRFKDKEKAFR